jgi:hypothetical protein
MNKIIKPLAILAVVQVALVFATWIGGTELKTQSHQSSLLSFEEKEIDRIVIKDQKNESILIKKNRKWQTQENFPVEQHKVDNLLTKLKSLKYSLPIATSQQALKRFKVADNDFERSVTLFKNKDTVATLYLGTGAGARQSHARNATQNAVYSVTMGSYDAPADIAQWQDKTVLQLNKATINSIEVADLILQADQSTDKKNAMRVWKASKLPEKKLLNQKNINAALEELSSIRFDKILGKSVKADYGLDKEALIITLVHNNGKREYRFGKQKDNESYVLKVSDREEFFQIASYKGKEIVEGFSSTKLLIDDNSKENPQSADSKKPESKELGTKGSEVKKPEIREPSVKKAEIKKPEVNTAEVKEPDVKKTEVKTSEVKEPEMKEPDVKKTEVKEPEVK